MRTRRGFLASLVALAVAPFANPAPHFKGRYSKWLLTGDPHGVIHISQRKMIARVRITQEVMDDCKAGAFNDFIREDFRQLAADILRAEERFLV